MAVKQMSIDTTPSQVATNALAGLPFSQIIGSPLKAAIEAQTMAAQTTWKFIQEVGLNTNKETGEKTAVNVSFDFMQNGKMARLNVPLLTIVPIPYIAINSIDINFKAKINAESSTHTEASESEDVSGSAKMNASFGWGPFRASVEASASYSSKKDSKATQDSKYSVEYTLDIAVKAGQDSMPAGLARVLDILNNSVSVSEPKGQLGATISEDENGKLHLVATYMDGDGIFQPDRIEVDGKKGRVSEDGRNAIFDLDDNAPAEVEVKAGESLSRKVSNPKK